MKQADQRLWLVEVEGPREHIPNRHDLWAQFKDEDAAGKR
jgi:hypothetical protein